MKEKEDWIFLFFLGLLSLNWPFLDIFSLFLPNYLLICWGILILAMAWISSHRKTDQDV